MYFSAATPGTQRESQSRPRVAFIHQPWSVIDPPVRTADSIALWTDEVAHRLVGRCESVRCYARLWQDQAPTVTHGGVEYCRKSISLDRWLRGAVTLLDERGMRSPTWPFYASGWCYRQFVAGVIADLRRRPVDVVHIQNFSQFVPPLRAAFPHLRIVLHMHAEWLAQLDRRKIGPRIHAADQIIFCSEFYAQETRAAWPEYADRCRTVYNGVTLEEFARPADDARETDNARAKRILFVSRISPDKGPHVLIDAMAEIVKQFPDAELKLIGPWATLPKSFCLTLSDERIMHDLARFYDTGKSYVEQLQERAAALGIADRVELTNQIERDELIRHYHQADVLVMPSIYPEGFGIPIIEAAACKVPAVVSSRGGMPEVVEDGRTGFIVPAADANSLATAILRLLNDDGLRRSMGRAAYERTATQFTWDAVSNSLFQTYTDLLNTPHLELTNEVAESA